MYCSLCKYEYRDGITVCPECGNGLTYVNPDAKEKPNSEAFNPNEKPKLLCTAANEFEADIIIAKLKTEGIYGFKKFKATDGYGRIVLGRTVLGVEIIVAESDYQTALEIID